MKKTAMIQKIEVAIENHSEETPLNKEELLISLLSKGAKIGVALAAINKAMREAGIVTKTKTGAVKECREFVEQKYSTNKLEGIHTFRLLREESQMLQEKFSINDDEEKGQKVAMKILRDAMKNKGVQVPRKVQLGRVKELTIDYFMDALEEGYPTSINGLAEWLVEGFYPAGTEITEEMRKKLKITAGTDYNFAYMMFHHATLAELN